MDGSMTMTSARTPANKPILKAVGSATTRVEWTQNHSGWFCRIKAMTPYREASISPHRNPLRLHPSSREWLRTFLQSQ